MSFTLSRLDRSSILFGDTLTFGSYHSAVEASGGVLAMASQGDTIQVAVEDEVLLRLRLEVAPTVMPMAGFMAACEAGAEQV